MLAVVVKQSGIDTDSSTMKVNSLYKGWTLIDNK